MASTWLFTHKQRTTSLLLKSCATDHATASTFLDAESYLHRWQRFSACCPRPPECSPPRTDLSLRACSLSSVIFVTYVVCSLLVSIWLYSSRGGSCCAEIRGLLDNGAGGNCSSLPTVAPQPGPSSQRLFSTDLGYTCSSSTPAGPCLGSLCDCGDLLTQFGTLPGAYIYSPTVQCSTTFPDHPSCVCHTTLEQFTCRAFPDQRVTDQVLVGLISVAICLPARILLEQSFKVSSHANDQGGWIFYAGFPRLLMGWGAHLRWRWTPQRPTDLAVWMSTVYPSANVWDFVAFAGWWVPKQLLPTRLYGALEQRFGGRSWSAGWVGVIMLLCGPIGWLFLIIVAATYRRQEPRSHSEHAAEEEPCGGPDGQSCAAVSVGVLAVLAVWAVYAWFIFTFGEQIYRRLGPDAEKTFAQSWGIGIGLNQAQQLQSVAQTVVKTAVLIMVLDTLRIRSNSAWLDDAADFASVQCMLFDGKARSWWQQTRELVARQYRSFGYETIIE